MFSAAAGDGLVEFDGDGLVEDAGDGLVEDAGDGLVEDASDGRHTQDNEEELPMSVITALFAFTPPEGQLVTSSMA